jgi:hypothetical protein
MLLTAATTAWRWQVNESPRHCPDCRCEQIFSQPHPGAGDCPDSPDGDCPEWYCTACGTAFLIAALPAVSSPASTGRARRVA